MEVLFYFIRFNIETKGQFQNISKPHLRCQYLKFSLKNSEALCLLEIYKINSITEQTCSTIQFCSLQYNV